MGKLIACVCGVVVVIVILVILANLAGFGSTNAGKEIPHIPPPKKAN